MNPLPTIPVVTTPVMYCQNATSVSLSATGTGLNWYTLATGGTGSATAPVPSTTTAGTINYYVSQTVNGCESQRVSIAVTVNALPTAPIVGTITQPTCAVPTGSVVLNGLPSSGTWTLTRSPGGTITTGTGTSKTITGLAPGTYTCLLYTSPSPRD